MSQNISKFGTILKRETLTSANLSKDIPYLILNSSDPYPGYYCSEEFPTDNSCKDLSFYLPIQEKHIREEVLCRISLEIQSKLSIKICPAWFNLEDSQIYAFRIKDIKESNLDKVIEVLEEYKFTFFKRKKIKNFLSYIHLKAFFELAQIEEGIYENTESRGLFYFNVAESLEWEEFERIITYQKSYAKFKNFDTAIGFWIQKPFFQDFIRIYGVNLELQQIEEIRKEFFRNMKKYMKQGMLI